MRSDFPFMVAGKLALVVDRIDGEIPWCIKSAGGGLYLTKKGTWERSWSQAAAFDYVDQAVDFAKQHASDCEDHQVVLPGDAGKMENNGKKVAVYCKKCESKGLAILSISIGPVTWEKS